MDTNTIKTPVKATNEHNLLFKDRAFIEARINEGIFRISDNKLRAACLHILGAGGKRIRPALMMTAYKACGGQEFEKAVAVAVALELIHNWTLIHDDIIDQSDLRRNVPSVHKKWDETVALLAGDVLNNLAYRFVIQSGFEASIIAQVLDHLTKASMDVIDGELMDVEFEDRNDLTEQDYLNMIGKKTGSLFSASAKIGAVLAAQGGEVVKAMERYGELVGLAFQVRDDLLDIVGNGKEFGKEIGKDIKEGKRTLMLLYVLNNSLDDDAESLELILADNVKTPEQVQKVIEIMERSGSLNYAEQRLSYFVKKAEEQLKVLEITPYRTVLESLASFISFRNK